jgi:hypothetical protein
VVIADSVKHEGWEVADTIGASAWFELLDVTKKEGWAPGLPWWPPPKRDP